MAAIVIDNGSYTIKAGLAGAKAPSVAIPTIVGQSSEDRDVFVGNDVQEKRGVLDLHLVKPITGGIVTNWDGMEAIWRHILEKDLELVPGELPVLLTQSPLNPAANKEKMVELMFEKFNVKQLHLATQAVLALQASGRTTGVVVDCGHGGSTVVPIYKGQGIAEAVTRVEVGGESLTGYLAKLLVEQDAKLSGLDEAILHKIKENMCYIAEDYEDDLQTNALSSALEQDYELPDGTSLTLGNERFRCPEVLFQPEHLGLDETPGLHEACDDSISRCDEEIRGEMFENIILCGGGARIPGMSGRLQKGVSLFASGKVDVICSAEPQNSAWIGGSIFASLAKYNADVWMCKNDYEDSGASIVHWKSDCI